MGLTSLEKLCLLQIAKDIKYWCCGVENIGFNGCLYMLGPFDHLGKYLTLFRYLNRSNSCQEHYFKMHNYFLYTK